VGRPPRKKPAPTNTATVEDMRRRLPHYEFAICDVCGDWAVIWEDDVYMGMHPMDCFDTATGQRIFYEKKRAEKETNQTLF
jgi:hypothetical protein